MGRRLAGSIVIWSIAVACLVPTLIVWRRTVADTDRVERTRLDQLVAAAEDLLTEQLVRFVDLLRAVDGHLGASEAVEPAEFALFVDRLRLAESYPGATSVLVFEPSGGGHTVVHAAPADDAPIPVGGVVGDDLDHLARALDSAAGGERALASASASSTDPAVAAGSDDPRAAGLELYVVRPIAGGDLLAGVRVDAEHFLAELATRLPDVRLAVTDLSDPAAVSVEADRIGEVTQLGRTWQVAITPTDDVLAASERRQPWIVLVAGLAASAAIIAFALHLGRARRRAVQLADRAARSEALHRQLLESAPVAIAQLGADGSVQIWNAAAADLFGMPASTVVGGPLVWPRPDEPVVLDGAAAVDALDGRTHRITTPHGERTVTAFTTTIPDATDQRLLLLLDETDQQRLEAQLVQAQKLEIFGRLAGGIAHDFNNFLTAVMGYIDIVLMRDRIEASDRNALVESRRAAERAASVVAQLLTISRRQVTIPQVVDVAALLHGLSDLLHTVAGDRAQLRIHVVPTGLDATVRIDRTNLEQIILNLVVNAGEAMIDAGHVDVWLETRDDEVVLRVVDDGPGLDPGVVDRVFEPFVTTKAGHGGTGLGLSTVYSIVTSAEGTISVTSTPGRGATFQVVFPRAVPDEAEPPAPARTPVGGPSNETILLVEDDPSVRRLTTAVLQQHGYRVISAGDAEEATSLFLEHRADIDLLLSDVVLPGRSGPQLAGELQRQRPELPVLFISGYAEGPLSEHGRLPEGTRFVGKPFRSDDLLREVHDAIAVTS